MARRITAAERRLLLQVLLHGPVTRAELSSALDLSTATIARLARSLIDTGIVDECAPVIHGRARPQVPLDIDPSRAHLLGINLTGTAATAVLTDMRTRSVWTGGSPLDSTAPDAVARQVAGLVSSCPRRPAVIGIGLGGSSADGRTVDRAAYLDWDDVPLADLVEHETGLPCVVSNDVDALAMAEGWFGAASGQDNFNVVTIGTGIGFAAIRGGQLVRGHDAGLVLGTLPFADPVDGVVLPGNDFATDRAMVSLYVGLSGAEGGPVSADSVADLARDGHPAAQQVVRTWARRSGIIISTGAAFTLPDLTLLMGERAGFASKYPDDLLDGLACVRDPTLPVPRVEVVPHDWASWARGAAVLAIRGLLGLEDAGDHVVQIEAR
ncbi:Transcriptional repressor [Acidipropionibacterium acidipropionici ATCC 4875]|uniref:Transcriptional repressor n=1 Tax=Acidipropionibacterium acidipropionici (strain ATCC 4875 / DSM 20272 / JCM 6432 / NBRC 12425 / NCIMB 8070 / 4) TaxID=1171373 RepID=K7S1T2_ACIA4|nr:Transcriptional repressor [Acidipropionibacterium acidipropionici ATCC 4875]